MLLVGIGWCCCFCSPGHQQPVAVRALRHGLFIVAWRWPVLALVIGWISAAGAPAAAASSAAGCSSSWRRFSGWWACCPGLLIYGVSYQFVSRSIESWFDVRVEGRWIRA